MKKGILALSAIFMVVTSIQAMDMEQVKHSTCPADTTLITGERRAALEKVWFELQPTIQEAVDIGSTKIIYNADHQKVFEYNVEENTVTTYVLELNETIIINRQAFLAKLIQLGFYQ